MQYKTASFVPSFEEIRFIVIIVQTVFVYPLDKIRKKS